MISYIFGALAIVAGMIAFVLALPAQFNNVLVMAQLSIALFAFSIALGVWRLVGLVEDWISSARQEPDWRGAPLEPSGALYEKLGKQD